MKIRAIAIFIVLLGAVCGRASANEAILSFHSDITVHADGSMTVRETIRVVSMGQQIRRGIYRDFPTTYRDQNGRKVVVGFEIERVERDGGLESYHTERMRNGIRIYFGRRDYLLPDGEHLYRFVYRTTRQLGFFAAHDELYWNVTGNGWAFPIGVATAVVRLPEGISESDMTLDAYTGVHGARGTHFTATTESPGVARFNSTRQLSPGEGLTIVVGFPKGFVAEPTLAEDVSFFVNKRSGEIAMLVGVLVVLAYYALVWLRVGVDPPKGRIVPREEPPEGFSPAALRYIRRMGLDPKCFSVALIAMAIKHYLHIEQQGDREFYIVRGQAGDEVLTDEERAIARHLFDKGDRIELTQSNHAEIGKARTEFWKVLSGQYKGEYFRRNGWYLFTGTLLAVAAIAGGVLASAGSFTWMLPVGVSLLPIINIAFGILLKAPTAKGRRVMDDIEGFRMFLMGDGASPYGVRASAEELGRRFEQYLPFAIALDRESEWADRFTQALSASSLTQQDYTPYWYHGSHWRHTGVQGFTGSLSGTFAGVVSSSTIAPGSSSGGGGGGSSGGGGGGGGGGGW